jgi:hypothetical protein
MLLDDGLRDSVDPVSRPAFLQLRIEIGRNAIESLLDVSYQGHFMNLSAD